MSQSKPRILVLSSVSLSVGPAKIAEDYLLAFRQYGLECDLLLLRQEENHPEYLFVREKDDISREDKLRLRVTRQLRPSQFGTNFFYTYEWLPLISPCDVVKSIHKKYDMVLTVFWQEGYSFQTMKAIHKKLNCMVMFSCVDFSTLSGGCHFFGDCLRYKVGCGNCPLQRWGFRYDFTYQNVRYRKRFIQEVKPVLLVNQYMKRFYEQSYLWNGYPRLEEIKSAIINTDVFRPMDRDICRRKYGIDSEKRFVIMFGCQHLTDPRKGMDYLLDALGELNESLTDEQASSILVMGVGRNHDKIASRIPFDFKAQGYVPMDTLPELFSLSDCFVCPSVNDAGPMMVNQSLCCGTPVVGFDMGAVQSVVKGQGTGYCATLKDTTDLARGLLYIFDLTDIEKEQISQKCRQVAMDTCSYQAIAQDVVNAYNKWQ